jgi:hypothetical protein
VAARPVEAERAAPVVADEDGVAVDAQLVEQRVEVRLVLCKRVALVARARELGRVAVAHEIGRDHPAAIRHVRDHVAPQVRRGGIAVQEDDRSPPALVDVGHGRVADLGGPLRQDGHAASYWSGNRRRTKPARSAFGCASGWAL